ncbi:hypothetical protein E2C01_032226 [Portunus trituberculatus]|uniref:Uncharacterized protein n=1 Tax=Portunus trituberculatus TaxID=210409 RepID=A0A5B7F286_PORTR|nr:hypothetical protein [Portunus trituberculatus]
MPQWVIHLDVLTVQCSVGSGLRMAGQYLVLQQEIFNLRQRKTVLEEKLSQAEKLERIGNQRYQDKIQELESKKSCNTSYEH